mgnify:CR=1 FL=1
MNIDTEKMRLAVLAECEAVCPDKLHAPIECGHLAFGYVEDDGIRMEAWFLYVGEATAPMSLYALAGEQVWLAAYRLLGLSERDAVAELREESDKYFTELKAERAKNAALVDRIELALSLSEDSDINRILGNALAANEKGGKGE